MTASHDKGLTPKEVEDRVWELSESIRICMFITWDGERQRARPLAAMPDRDEHAIYFLTDVNGVKDDQIEKFPIVSMAFADTGGNKYVSITGHATVTNDRAKIKELWSAPDKAWWDSAEDPSIRIITVTPEDAELWDGPGKVVSAAKMLSAAITGDKPDMGINSKIRM